MLNDEPLGRRPKGKAMLNRRSTPAGAKVNVEPTPNRVRSSLLGIAEVRTDERRRGVKASVATAAGLSALRSLACEVKSRNKVYFDFTKQGGGNASRKEEKTA